MSTPHPTPRFRPLLAVALTLVAVVILAACSSSASSSATGGGSTTVTISGRSFGSDITISAGDSVVFHNADGFTHTVTNGTNGVAVENPAFDQQVAAGADSEPIVLDTPGTYDVTCKIHTTMHMVITVE